MFDLSYAWLISKAPNQYESFIIVDQKVWQKRDMAKWPPPPTHIPIIKYDWSSILSSKTVSIH